MAINNQNDKNCRKSQLQSLSQALHLWSLSPAPQRRDQNLKDQTKMQNYLKWKKIQYRLSLWHIIIVHDLIPYQTVSVSHCYSINTSIIPQTSLPPSLPQKLWLYRCENPFVFCCLCDSLCDYLHVISATLGAGGGGKVSSFRSFRGGKENIKYFWKMIPV